MLKLFFGIILFYFCLSNTTIEHSTPSIHLIPATPTKTENWNEYIVLSGNNFLNNYYIKPLRIKKKN
jgi:hypothetical protein